MAKATITSEVFIPQGLLYYTQLLAELKMQQYNAHSDM